MQHGWYILFLWLHIIAATFWIGGMLFLVAVLIPALKNVQGTALRSSLMRAVGIRFRAAGWACLGVLLLSGFGNLAAKGIPHATFADPAFWSTSYGFTLGLKLAVFLLILALSAWHDFILGPKAGAALRQAPHDPETMKLRNTATWFGRLNLLLAFVMVFAGIALTRGWPW